MALDLIPTSFLYTSLYSWIQRSVAGLLTLLILIIFIYHTIKSIGFIRVLYETRNININTNDDLPRILTHLFTCLTLFWYLILAINYNLNIWSIYTEYDYINDDILSCDTIEIISVGSYHLGKGFLYLVLILRLKSCFQDSTYYKKLKCGIRSISVILCLYVLVAIYGDIFHVSGNKAIVNNNTSYCLLDPLPLWTIITMLIFDMTISIGCLCLFNYPLRHIIRTSFRDES